MNQVLPIIIVCALGLTVCIALLVVMFVKHLHKRKKKCKEVFDMDERTLTINLNDADLK